MTRLLLLDDDAETRQALRALFEEDGYVVEEARGAGEALATLRGTTHVYVVVIDLFLPRMIGMTLLRELDRDAALAERHGFAATSAAPSALSSEARGVLARLHIPLVPKPFDLETICDVVAEAAARVMLWCHAAAEEALFGEGFASLR